MISTQGRHFPREMIFQTVRWYLAYALSSRGREEMMTERGTQVDHATVMRWVDHFSPQFVEAFRSKKKQTGKRWRLDETYIKVKGDWKYFYRTVDKEDNTIDFLLMDKRNTKAALRSLIKAIGHNGKPSLINIDKSGANKVGINAYNKQNNTQIEIRQCKYLNNIVEQDHRGIKKVTRPMLGFKNFQCAQRTLEGIELVRMLKKCQMRYASRSKLSPADHFYSLAE